MKKVVIIGGKGKVGTYLVPMLVTGGYAVTNVSRGESKPFVENACWNAVEQVMLDTAAPDFARNIASLKPDIVVDMIAFNASKDLVPLMDALAGQVEHLLVCGSIWAHGSSTASPLDEEDDLNPFGEYGIEKCKFIREVQKRWALSRFPGTVVHPGHIVGPGHPPVNPHGNHNSAVFSALMHGQKALLPNFGMETLHHVHAEDVAGVFYAAIRAGSVSYGQHFHAVSPGALSLRGYATAVAGWFGKEANLEFLPFTEWAKTVSQAEADETYEHIVRSHNCSMERAKRLLGFAPKHTSLEAIRESVFDMVRRGVVK